MGRRFRSLSTLLSSKLAEEASTAAPRRARESKRVKTDWRLNLEEIDAILEFSEKSRRFCSRNI